jgi:hypothetical protein
MLKINYKVKFYILHLKERIKGGLLRFGSQLFSKWLIIDNDFICTIGKVLKLNRLYTYEESDYVDIVRLTDVHFEQRFFYLSMFFESKNKIITVRLLLLKGIRILWRLIDNKEFDELISSMRSSHF